MKKTNSNSCGLSETASVILVIVLILVLAMVVYILVSGAADPKYMQKTVYIAGETRTVPLDISRDSDYILTYLPKAGDPFHLIGQKLGDGTPVTMRIFSPDGRNLTPDTSLLTGSLYGKTLYIFQKSTANACEYLVSDARPAKIPPPMVNGVWKVQFIDERTHVLADTYSTTFTKGTTSLPVTILQGTGKGGKSYRADCSASDGMCGGICPLQFNTSPCNMTYSRFTGSNYLTFPDDPTLDYTGDLSISVSFRPTATGDYSDPGNWHQIMGKGVIDAGNNEVDNYQIFQVGNKLVFEWNDRDNPSVHYQAITTSSPVIANNWNDLTVSITNGVLTMYNNGVPLDLAYSRGVDPRSITTPVPNPPVVKLLNNNNAVTIGKQNGPGSSSYFYFNGDIGGISLFNRGLTQSEVNARLCQE